MLVGPVGLSAIYLAGPQNVPEAVSPHPVDGVVGGGEVGGAADVEFPVRSHEGRGVVPWRVGTLSPAVDPLEDPPYLLGLSPGAGRAEGVGAAGKEPVALEG